MGNKLYSACSRRHAMALAALLALGLLTNGCSLLIPDQIHHVVKTPEQPAACPTGPAQNADHIVGVALSGGGSRSAVFGAAVLEALAEHRILGQITHVSSVSGGSLPASYLLTIPPDCSETADQENRACRDKYFSEFKTQMRVNYQPGMLLRNLVPWRFSSPTRRATSLREVLDSRFLHDITFGELEPHPVVLINAASYDENRRFVFSNGCLEHGAADSSTGLITETAKRYQAMAETALAQRALRARTFSRPQCAQPVPNDMPVSLAVVASLAFPPAIGPISIEVPRDCDSSEREWWHIGDGGVIENSGIDSLHEVVLRRLTAGGPPLKKALILSANAGARLDPEQLQSRKNFGMYTDPSLASLVVDSPKARGQAYHDIFWAELLDELTKEDIKYEKITFRHSKAELDELPASCDEQISSADSISGYLAAIPTNLGIDKCSADLLEMAAHQLVHTRFDAATVTRLDNEGLAIHPVSGCSATMPVLKKQM